MKSQQNINQHPEERWGITNHIKQSYISLKIKSERERERDIKNRSKQKIRRQMNS